MAKHYWSDASQIAFSPDGRWRAWSGYDCTARLWDFDSDRTLALKGHSEPLTCIAFSRGGGRIATGSFDGTLRLWAVG